MVTELGVANMEQWETSILASTTDCLCDFIIFFKQRLLKTLVTGNWNPAGTAVYLRAWSDLLYFPLEKLSCAFCDVIELFEFWFHLVC